MKIAQYKHYIAKKGDTINKNSQIVANALFAELFNYGIIISDDVLNRIAYLGEDAAYEVCQKIQSEYSVGALNPPLFKNWEQRKSFTFDEFVIQIFGYIFQISGNDLKDENFTKRLTQNIDFSKFRHLTLASKTELKEYVNHLFNAQVSQDKKTFLQLTEALKYLDAEYLTNIKSDEVRIIALIEVSKNQSLFDSFELLHCKPTDVLRHAAALNKLEYVKLPADVKYANLSWRKRIDSLRFLSKFDFEALNESMGLNRAAWIKYFNHIHLLSQRGFAERFPNVCLAFFVANGNRLEKANSEFTKELDSLIANNVVEVTSGGTLAYRTFASRIQSAIENKDFKSIKSLGEKRPNYILRNLTAVSNGISKENNKKFVEFIRSILKVASPDVLFSILSIDVGAKWRVIDVKGDTRVEKADYNSVIKDIQNDIEIEICKRYGFSGKVTVSSELKNNIVPFLAKNTNLARGSTFNLNKGNYLYLFTHWIQKNERTDLDLSFVCFDKNWTPESVWYGRQANGFIAHSGDITNAPAPNGATEYGCISLAEIPKHIKYIVPIINVYTGEVFAESQEVKAGFIVSKHPKFTLSREHNTYKLDQPAQANFPFVFDVDNNKIILLDVNCRERMSASHHGYNETIKNMIEAVQTKNYITIEKLAKILSGDNEEVSLKITPKANKKDEIAPESLFNLFN